MSSIWGARQEELPPARDYSVEIHARPHPSPSSVAKGRHAWGWVADCGGWTLSPGERENCRPSLGDLARSGNKCGRRRWWGSGKNYQENTRWLFPLLGGEGQGEGEPYF